MLKGHVDVLSNNRAFLVKNLFLTEDFYSTMRENKILTENMEEEIRAKPSREGSVGKFLDDLIRRGPYAYDQFTKALTESGQYGIIDKIEPDPKPYYEGPAKIKEYIDSESANIIDEKYLKRRKNYEERINSNLNYPNDGQRGRVALINVKYFLNEKTRNGSEKDVEKLVRMFTLMGYDISTLKDKSRYIYDEDVQKFLKSEQELMERNGPKYFIWILIIMSHGESGCFIVSDDTSIRIDGVMQLFDGINCPGLINVPKVFFFQCCFGEKKSGGVCQGVQNLRISDSKGHCEMDANVCHPTLNADQNFVQTVHEKADVFEAYCSVDGYSSWRSSVKGSWFIRTVVYIFSRFARHEDLQSMMMMVNDVVAKFKTDTNCIQQPRTTSTLRKKLFLF